jgi:hypothetical protein
MTTSSEFVTALRQGGNQPVGSEFFDYADPQDFQRLWHFACAPDPAPPPLPAVAIIAWDGRVPGAGDSTAESLLAPHLAPLDWALAFSLALLAGRIQEGGPSEIRIIDLRAPTEAQSWSDRMRHQLTADLPWVHLYATMPQAANRVAGGVQPLYAGLDLVLVLPQHEQGFRLPGQNDPDTPRRRERIAALSRQWVSSVVTSDENHDINNVIGAHLLLRVLQPDPAHRLAQICATRTPLQNAFLQRVDWCGLLVSAGDQNIRRQVKQLRRAVAALSAGRHAGPVDIVVIDDMLTQGWSDVLLQLMGATPTQESDSRHNPVETVEPTVLGEWTADGPHNFRLLGSTKPDWIVSRLCSNDISVDKRDFGIELVPPATGEHTARRREFLLLDLRLYEDRARDHFKGQLARIWTYLRVKISNKSLGLAWSPITEGEATVIDQWLQGTGRSAVPVEVLTLLPRVLALAFPLLPIILFSSTGRADVKERLKPYRNIFTGFEKPRVMGSALSVERNLASLHEALLFAEKIGQAGAAFREMNDYVGGLQVQPPVWATRAAPKYFEVFVDETGSPTPIHGEQQKDLSVVLTVLAFATEADADSLQTRLEELAKRSASTKDQLSPSWVRWRGGPTRYLKKPTPPLALRQFEEGARALTGPLKHANATCFSVAIERMELGLGPMRWDAEYDRMLKTGIEAVTRAILPLFGCKDFAWRVFLPQRMAPCSSESVALDLERIWGVEPTHLDRDGAILWFGKTYPAGSYYPLLRDLMQRWQGSTQNLLSGRGIELNYFEHHTCNSFGDAQVKWPRWIAGLADWVAFARRFPERRAALAPIVQDLGLRNNSLVHANEVLDLALEAIRLLTTTHGSRQQAARFFLASWAAFGIGKRAKPPQATSARVAHALFLRLREELQSLGGDDLIGSALAYVPPAAPAQPTEPSGQYVIEQEHSIAIENDVDRVLVAHSITDPSTRIALAERLGADAPKVGETIEVELAQPNGVVDIANESDTERLNFYWVIRRGSEAPIIHVEESPHENAHSSILVGDAVHPEPATSVSAEPQASDSNALLLTVSEVVGVFRVLADKAGSQFALRHSGPGLGVGEVVRCIAKTNTAEVRLGWKLPVVIRA